MTPTFLLLLVGVPPTPSSLRVRVWRRLRSLGAVALKRSAYLLPDTPERYEDFQWLAQEIQREGGGPTLDLTKLRGRRWVTRPRPHIDRIGSAWLIKRFIDPDAEFLFAPPAEFPNGAIPFDAPGVELTHHGEDCTFETLVKRARLRDRRLARLAEVVHEADLRDGKYPHEEARGIDVAVRALLAASSDDHQVLAQGMTLFEGLYANTSRKA